MGSLSGRMISRALGFAFAVYAAGGDMGLCIIMEEGHIRVAGGGGKIWI